MGKGDKKSRRGKIILGTFGIRRRRKKVNSPEVKPLIETGSKDTKDKRPVREKAEIKEVKSSSEVKEPKAPKEKAAPKATKTAKEKKDVAEGVAEPKPKKEKKS
ncbi:MAG: 30S ribosomal protein THX [Bacteroidales bacterium]|nr:30S ribosomal protein THX [Bacteroidales bacterium]